jgi:phosphoglycolate phosphatase
LKYRLVLFDFDFTLVDASECLFAALREGLASIGAPIPSDSQLKLLIGLPLAKQYEVLSGKADLSLFATFKRVYLAERGARESVGTHLLPGVASALERLNRDGYQLGVVSTGAAGRIRRALIRFNLLVHFTDNGIIGEAEDKAIALNWALSHFHTEREQTVYVGDRPDDGDAAKVSGVSFVAVTTGAFEKCDFPRDCKVIVSLEHLFDCLR